MEFDGLIVEPFREGNARAGCFVVGHGAKNEKVYGFVVKPIDFNQYGTRRGNHEVLIRGTFANIRLRNKLAEKEGWWTRRPVHRTYFDLVLADGRNTVVFCDRRQGRWYEQRA